MKSDRKPLQKPKYAVAAPSAISMKDVKPFKVAAQRFSDRLQQEGRVAEYLKSLELKRR